MKKEWINATVAPRCEGFYEVRVISPGEPEHKATITSAEWRDGQWWMATSSGSGNGALTPGSSWREIWVSRAC